MGTLKALLLFVWCVNAEFRSNVTTTGFFDVYNPYRLAGTWGLQDVRTSNSCYSEMETFLASLQEGRLWAMKMVDASGWNPSAFFWGNYLWTGSSKLCLSVARNETGAETPLQTRFFSVDFQLNVTLREHFESRQIRMGVCLPRSCNVEDAREIVLASADNSPYLAGTVSISKVKNPNEPYSPWKNSSYVLLMVIIGTVAILTVIGTALDIFLSRNDKDIVSHEQQEKDIRLPANGTSKDILNSKTVNRKIISKLCEKVHGEHANCGVFTKLFLSFSIRINSKWIFNMEENSKEIPSLHGIRFISMMWIIMFHTSLISGNYMDNKMAVTEFRDSALYIYSMNAVYAVDTFFLASGLLVSLTFHSRRPDKDEAKNAGAVSFLRNFLTLVVKRYWRLSPPYFLMLLITKVSSATHYIQSFHETYQSDHDICEKFMWRNLLYINTWFPEKEMCMKWSWFLANDFQFYIIGTFLVMLSLRHMKTATSALVLMLLGSWSWTAFIAFSEKAPVRHLPNILNFDLIYGRPWTRIPPYIIGIFTGWMIFKTKRQFRTNKFLAAILWILSVLGMHGLVFLPYKAPLDRFSSAAFLALSRSVWALQIAWVVIACASGIGGTVNSLLSWKGFRPLGRLTYCAYLLHMLIIRNTMLANDGAFHLYSQLMVVLFFGYLFISYLAAYLLCLGFEIPSLMLMKLVFDRKRQK